MFTFSKSASYVTRVYVFESVSLQCIYALLYVYGSYHLRVLYYTEQAYTHIIDNLRI